MKEEWHEGNDTIIQQKNAIYNKYILIFRWLGNLEYI